MTPERIVWEALLLGPVAWAGWVDWRERRIPNAANLLLFCLGLAAQNAAGAPAAALAGSALGLALGLAPALVFGPGGIGGGDLKMMAALGAWYGPEGALRAFLAGGLIAAAAGLFRLARSGRLGLWLLVLPFKNRERMPEEAVPLGTCLAMAVFLIEGWKILTAIFF